MVDQVGMRNPDHSLNVSLKRQQNPVCRQPTSGIERKRRGKEVSGRNQRHPTMWQRRLVNFRPFNEWCSARAGSIGPVTPSLSAGAVTHCDSHSSHSAKDEMTEEQHTSFPVRSLTPGVNGCTDQQWPVSHQVFCVCGRNK